MTGKIIDLEKARQNIKRPRFAPRKLSSLTDPLPETVYSDLMEDYDQIYIGSRGWIAIDKQGTPFDVSVIQIGPNAYDFTALAGYQMRGPDNAA